MQDEEYMESEEDIDAIGGYTDIGSEFVIKSRKKRR